MLIYKKSSNDTYFIIFWNFNVYPFYMYDVLKYFKNCNKDSLIIKVHVNVFSVHE
jgi:hypothetical protein